MIAKRVGPRASRRAQRRERARGARGDAPPRRHARDAAVETFRGFRGLPHRTALVADALGRHVLERFEGDERRRDAQEPRGLRGRARAPHPRRQGQGRRLRPPRARSSRRRRRRVLAIGKAAPAIAKALRSVPGVARVEPATLEKAVEEAARRAVPGRRRPPLARVRVLRPVPQLRAPRRGLRAAREAACPSRSERSGDGQEAGLRPPPLRLRRPPRGNGPPHDLQRVLDADLPAAPVRARAPRTSSSSSRRSPSRSAASSRSPRCPSTTAGSNDPRLIAAGLLVLAAALVAVLFRAPVNGARRWLALGFVSIQPSEFAKVALVSRSRRSSRAARTRWTSRRRTLLPVLGIVAVPAGLVLLEPDFGTAFTYFVVAGAMLFFAGLPVRWFLGLRAPPRPDALGVGPRPRSTVATASSPSSTRRRTRSDRASTRSSRSSRSARAA